MANIEAAGHGADTSGALAIPAVLSALFQQDLAPSSAQLTWLTDAFL
jgi:hypothetical protein